MSNASFRAVPASAWASSENAHYSGTELIRWFRDSGTTKAYPTSFTPTLGNQQGFTTNVGAAYGGYVTGETDPFWPIEGNFDKGFAVTKPSTTQMVEFNLEVKGGIGHWMPCPIVRSISYFWNNETNANSNFVPRRVGLILKHWKSDAEHRWSLGLDQSHTANATGRLYVHNSSSKFNEVRGLGPDWYVYGVVFNFKSGSTGSPQVTRSRLVDFRLGHEVVGLTGTSRIILPKAMSWGNFTDSLKRGEVKYGPT